MRKVRRAGGCVCVCVCVCVQFFDLFVHVCICLYFFIYLIAFVIYFIVFLLIFLYNGGMEFSERSPVAIVHTNREIPRQAAVQGVSNHKLPGLHQCLLGLPFFKDVFRYLG